MTQETKNKISESMKRLGLKPPSRSGRKCSEETKKKMRLSNIGKKRSQYTKDKMSKTRTGRIGKLCNSWNGGVSKECEKIRGSREYLFWRKYCYC